MAGASDQEWQQYIKNRSSLLDSIERDRHHGARMRQLAHTRTTHTYVLRVGCVSFSLYLQWNEVEEKEGQRFLWVKMEGGMIPDALIPEDITRDVLRNALHKIGWHGWIEGRFVEENGGMFVASEGWVERFDYVIDRIRSYERKQAKK